VRFRVNGSQMRWLGGTRNVSSIVRQLCPEFREQLLSLTRRWPVSHTSVV